ncbi:MAG: SDR family oxidoreductase, partial [Phycisphaerales bacterium]|nr:SDR family oxidoreductase [Phycisphaerales bacterium]
MSKRIVITGGGGFVGSHLSRRLLDEGNTIVCIDNFFTSCKRTIEPLLDHPSYELITHDIIEPVFVTDVDQIYNLACPAAPGHYQFNPVRTVKTSVMGVINMLGMAKVTGARILQASTSEVYGDPTVSPQPETYRGNVNPIGRRACYDEGKRAAETLFFDYHRENHVDIRVARIFNTYGPNMHPFDGRVVSNFIRQALAGEDITIFGEGSQTRSFCYVSDLVDGLIRLMNTDDLTGPINLGNPQERTILDLAEHVIELTESTSQLVRKPLPPD